MMKYVCVLLVLSSTSLVAAQECFRNQIGLDPIAVTRTPAQEANGLIAASRITPRRLDGTSASNGKVVFVGVGMSNTSNVWGGFRTALNQAGAAPRTLKWIDGTQGGAGAPQWADPTCTCWTALDQRLIKQGVSAAQVQAVFLMLVTPYPWQTPAINATRYAQDVASVLTKLQARFPYLRIVYLAGDYYGGYDTGQDKIPEPHGYYENATLQALQDGHTGPVWVSASSTYLWTDGARPRAWDGLTLRCPADVTQGGVHLSAIGSGKYGTWLYTSLMNDVTTSGWLR